MLSSLLIGAAAGLRTATPLAVVALGRRQDRPKTAAAAVLAAAGEFVVDKLPQTSARTDAAPAIARVASGALAGGAL